MIATFLIGLREGLEAALVVAMLVAYVVRLERRDVLPRLWLGVALAVGLSVAAGAILTFGAYTLTFQAQEIIGGTLSLLAVGLVTWMVFWMQRTAASMKRTLEGHVDRALAAGGLWAVVVIGFVSVIREGLETTLLLWSMVQSFGAAPVAVLGAVAGLVCAAIAGVFLARGLLRVNIRTFFAWTGGVLVIAAAGVLAYAVKDLQEAGVLIGPFTTAAPVDPTTGAVVIGWAGFPFGWAFDVSAVVAPGEAPAMLLQALIGFMPRMSWLQVVAWVLYVLIVGGLYLRGLANSRRATAARTAASGAATPTPPATPAEPGSAVPVPDRPSLQGER